MSEDFTILFPRKLVFGKGCMQRIADELVVPGTCGVFVLTIEPLLPALHDLLNSLAAAGMAVTVDTSVVREPSFADFNSILARARESRIDVVLGIGGGSVLDVAKLIAAQVDGEQELSAVVGNGLLAGRRKKLVCVPATSGTGSEVSPNAILVDDGDNQKKGIISPFLVPDVVYVDPLLTLTLPAAITAATGLDALTHCLEAYTNKFSRPFIDMYAYEGMRLIAEHLVDAVKDGFNENARTEVAMGSLLGGFCLGPVNTAAVHALSYPLGSLFHLAHGLSNALLLPHVMEFNIPASPQKYAEVAIALGCTPGTNATQTAFKGVEKIRRLITDCGIPAHLRDVGIGREEFPRMAADALKIDRLLKNNPRPVTYEDALSIYESAY